jgi:alpha-methylacyl-CoA racemase
MGPLAGTKIIELAGLGAAPYCCMMLADMGCDVVRIERNPPPAAHPDILARNRTSIAIDLKSPDGVEILLRLLENSDVLIEGFRPGVMERAGIGPDVCLQRNRRLVYGRMTGWGQDGPLAETAGHDLNYIALSGALHPIGLAGNKPVPPLNLVGDFGGGLLLAFGVASALVERQSSGKGQVVDAAMLDAAASFMAMFQSTSSLPAFGENPGEGMLAGAAHFYDTYLTKDGKYISIAAIEPHFYRQFIDKLELDPDRFMAGGFSGLDQDADVAVWQALKKELKEIFLQRTRDEWCALLEGTDCCFAPVLALSEAHLHPHNKARKTFDAVDGILQQTPAPRFSRSKLETPNNAAIPGADTHRYLSESGYSARELDQLVEIAVIPPHGD